MNGSPAAPPQTIDQIQAGERRGCENDDVGAANRVLQGGCRNMYDTVVHGLQDRRRVTAPGGDMPVDAPLPLAQGARDRAANESETGNCNAHGVIMAGRACTVAS